MSIGLPVVVSREELAKRVVAAIRTINDFPKVGIPFKDIMPIFKQPALFAEVCSAFVQYIRENHSDATCIAALESRGFFFGPVIAAALNLPFIALRKAGKLPGDVERVCYSLEYGSATIEVQCDAFARGDRIVIFDDIIATGGTLMAAAELARRFEAVIIDCCVVIELPFLNGRQALEKVGLPLYTLVELKDE